MARDDTPLAKLRRICLALPGTSEGTHSGSIAFKAGTKMFAVFDAKAGLLKVGLESAHASFLLDHDPRFTPYPRAKDVVCLDASKVADWSEVEALVKESYGIATAAKKPAAKKTAKRPTR